MGMRATGAALALLSLFAAAPAATAGCYEVIGCTHDHYIPEDLLWQLGCEPLYDVRNMTYKENGYCFSTQKAIARFGNEGCYIADAAAVPLNAYERANVALIRKVEKAKGCY
jgi:hypothetical protein